MSHKLPSRPNLDHLRRQAKSLLAALAAGDADAAATFRAFLPAAADMNAQCIRAAGFRLADAQSAIARKSGFEAWPRLARHVEQLRALEGTWSFVRLEVDGEMIPPAALSASRLLIDGDRFRTESPEGLYEGIFNIDVETDPPHPHQIDLEFIAGPEAGNTNRGIFRVEGDDLEICLDTTGASRPTAFRTSPGTGHACETLRRTAATRPEAVTGGTPPPPPPPQPPAAEDSSAFQNLSSPTLTRLQGRWSAERILRDGMELPGMMLKMATRQATGNELKITVGGTLMIHALVRIREPAAADAGPIPVDYYNLGGPAKGTIQHGIMEWRGDSACFCMAAAGAPRPSDFEAPSGSGRTLSQWKRTT